MGLASLLAGGPLCARPTPLIGKGRAQHQRAKWPEPAVVVTVSEWRDLPHYHPHDLRHRRITVWHQSGVVARELAERAGHARASITLDVYSHVMPLSEAAAETLAALAREMG